MDLPPSKFLFRWRTLRDLAFYAAVLFLPGGILIALGRWLVARVQHGRAAQRAAVVLPIYAVVQDVRSADDLDVHLFV